jgi:hypothetical protein
MARIQQTIQTSKSALEMRLLIDTKVLTRPEVAMLITEHRWEENVLHASGKMGSGTITVADQLVTVDIELSLFGSAAKGAIEQTLKEKIKMLDK